VRSGGGTLPERHAPAAASHAIKHRQKEVGRRLEAAGLVRAALKAAPRWLEPPTVERGRRFREEVGRLGPVYACFGRYLATRLDHLQGEDCRALARLADEAEPMPQAEVSHLLRSELGASALVSLARIEPVPEQSLGLFQTHRGVLADGQAVTVKLARTTLLSDPDRAVLPGLASHLSSLGWPLEATRQMLAEFDDRLERRLDLFREAEVLGRLRLLPAETPHVGAPRVIRALSSARVLTTERLPGLVPFRGRLDERPRADDTTGPSRTLTDLWMRLVFGELRIPEELSAADVWIGPGGVLVLSGGLFQPIPPQDGEALWRYLVAAARDETDAAFEALQGLVRATPEARPQGLRQVLGHVVPRRDGRFGETPPGFPELLLAHWTQLARHGYVPEASLLAFYRGIVALRDLTGPALSRAVLRESLQVTQIARGSERVRKALDPSLLTRTAEGAVKMLLELPRTLERSVLLGRSADARPAERRDTEPADVESGWTAIAVWLLLAATLLIWFQRFPTLLGPWTETAQAAVLVLLGVGLLRSIWKG
jgi:hypothetical protein